MSDTLTKLGQIAGNLRVPPVQYSFIVVLMPTGAIPNLVDIRFSKVSGISSKVELQTLEEGGENLSSHHLPNRMSYETLKLERGMVIGSLLNIEFELVMSSFKLSAGNVLVALVNKDGLPTAGWLYLKTYPVGWSVSDLDANQNDLVIDTMEFTYQRFLPLRL
ncbi:MAG: phage tail-like protein [Phenylobacterium sp.]